MTRKKKIKQSHVSVDCVFQAIHLADVLFTSQKHELGKERLDPGNVTVVKQVVSNLQ